MTDPLATASVLIRPDTTKFRAELLASLKTATKGIVVPIPVVATAAAKGAAGAQTAVAVATKQAAVANIELASATAVAKKQQLDAAAVAKAEALAHKEAAAAALKHAAAQSQLARGAGATGLSLLGARGATLAAGSQFLIGAAAVTLFAKAIKGASEDQEALAATTRILGAELANRLDKQANNLINSFGLIDDEVLRFESTLAQIFISTGIAAQRTAQFSETLVKLAADIAAVKDIPVVDVFKALQSALLGNVRGLKQLGIGLTATEINQRAMADSGKKNATELTSQEKVMARYALILERTTNFQGGFAAESDRLAGRSKVLRANIDQLSDSVGEGLIPVINELVTDITFLLTGLNKLPGPIRKVRSEFEKLPEPVKRAGALLKEFWIVSIPFVGPTIEAARLLRKVIGDASNAAREGVPSVEFFGSALQDLQNAATGAANALAGTQRAADNLNFAQAEARIKALDDDLKNLIIAGQATPAARIAILQQQRADALDELASARGTKKIREARDKAAGFTEQIEQIQKEQAAAAKSAASAAEAAANKAAADAKSAAAKIQAARDAADQALLDSLGFRRGQLDIKIARAENTKGLQDDIRAQVQLRNFIAKEISIIAKRIKDEQLRKETIQALRQALVETRGAIKDLFRELRQNRIEERKAREEERKARQEALIESLQLDVQFAATNENVRGEIRAREALIRELRRQQNRVKRGTNEWKRLRNEIAAEQQAIKDLKKQVKDRSKAAKELQFAFLQAQQGFAASILSNLLPAGVIGGTVGGGQGNITRMQGLGLAGPNRPGFARDTGGGRGEGAVGMGVSEAAQKATAAGRTTTIGQTQTMIEILRQILRVLSGQSRGAQHPEARHQRSSGSATMDIL